MAISGELMNKTLGYTLVDLDCRFGTVRQKENGFGNFVCDLYRSYAQTDISFINSGFIRHDYIIPAGSFAVK